MAPGEPLLRALGGLRFHHKAQLSGVLPRARLVVVVAGGRVSRFQYSKPLAPAGLGRARLKVEGPLCLGGHLGFTSPKAQTGNCRVLVVAFISF